jgi:hypothetical protein
MRKKNLFFFFCLGAVGVKLEAQRWNDAISLLINKYQANDLIV